MMKTLLLACAILLAGCAKDSSLRLQIDESVSAHIDKKIVCPAYPQGTCSIESEFHELAERAGAESTSESPRHYVSLLDHGQDALLARVHLIRAAKRTIELQTYIWHNDEVGRLIFFELLNAARRGAKVRIIVDSITVSEDPGLLARLATSHANLEIAFYNPEFSRGKTTPLSVTAGALFSFRKINQRMHNKVFIVDGQIGIVGGRNIENKYYDYSPDYNFKDRDAIIIGPAVMQMRESFERYWNDEIVVRALYLVDVGEEVLRLQESGEPSLLDRPEMSFFSDMSGLVNRYALFEDRPAARPFATGRIEFIADLPGKPSQDERETVADSSQILRELVGNAEKSVTVQTPYFALSSRAYKMLIKMRRQNPDLKFTVSSNSLAATDLDMIYAITFKQKRKLIKNLKINLFEFKPYPGDAREYIHRYDLLVNSHERRGRGSVQEGKERMPAERKQPRFGMHAKSIVIDGRIAVIGSHNLTPRSANINTEVVAIIWDKAVAKKLEQNILKDTEPQNSWVIAKRQQVPVLSYFSNIMGSISSMLPVFDIWPFRYSSSFQLKEGMEPLPLDHPDFYEHYEDVGQFPEINQSPKSVRTRLIKSFGGFIAPLI